MKVKLTKHHVLGVAEQVIEVSEDQANYLIRVGAAKEVKKENKVDKTKTETK